MIRSIVFMSTLMCALALAMPSVAQPATPAPARAPYPWEKQGLAVPEFTVKPIAAHPALLMDPADMPRIKARYTVEPMTGPLNLLFNGEPAERARFTAGWMAEVRRKFDVPEGPQIPSYRRYSETLYAYDIVAALGFLSDKDKAEVRALMFRGVRHYVGPDPAHLASKATPLTTDVECKTGFSKGNRWTDAYVLGGLFGLTFPDHPYAHDYVKYAIVQTRWQLDNSIWAGGAWSEVPRYHNWTLLVWIGWFDALKHRTGVDLFQNPGLKSLLDWPIRFSSGLVQFPNTVKRNPKGEPTTPAWGDSNYGTSCFITGAMYAPFYAESDPALSRRLMWMWRRAGSPPQHGWQFDTIFPQIVDPTLPDAPQTLTSAFSREPGYVLLRSGFDTPDETVVTMRGGTVANHRRNDLGSIDLFSQGIPLACGAQSGPYRSPEIEWNRWVGANNDVAFVPASSTTGKTVNPHVWAPDLQSVPGGRPLTFFTSRTVDYAAMEASRPLGRFVPSGSEFTWVRHLVLAKQPDYLVVWDQCTSPMASRWFLHTTAARFEWKPGLIVSHTDYGADLDIHVLSPRGQLPRDEREGPFGGWMYDDTNRRKESPYPFTMLKYVTLSAAPGVDYVTVLHPRKTNGEPLSATLVSQTRDRIVVRLEVAGRIDTFTLTTRGGTYQRGAGAPVDLPMTVPGGFEPGYKTP